MLGAPAPRVVLGQQRLGPAPRRRNITRIAGVFASVFHAKATTGTIRAQRINVPGRLANSARKIVLHPPGHWPWGTARNQMTTTDREQPPLAARPNRPVRQNQSVRCVPSTGQ